MNDELPLTKYRFSLASKTNEELLSALMRLHGAKRVVSIGAFVLVRSIICIALMITFFRYLHHLKDIFGYVSVYFVFLAAFEEFIITLAIDLIFHGRLDGILAELVQRKDTNLLTKIDGILRDNRLVTADPNAKIYCESFARLLPSSDGEALTSFCAASQRLMILCLNHQDKEVRASAKRILSEHGNIKVLENLKACHSDHLRKSPRNWRYSAWRLNRIKKLYDERTIVPESILLASDESTYALFETEMKECIAQLSDRLEKENTSATLLRASFAPRHDTELLRSAHGSLDTSPETLMRPSEMPGSEKATPEIASKYLDKTPAKNDEIERKNRF